MISQTEIETYAVQIAKPDFDVRTVRWLIGHLDSDDRKAVLMRAAQIEVLVAREAQIIAEMALERMEKEGRFPKGSYISPNRKVWFEDEIIAWQNEINGRGRGRRQHPIRPKS